MMDEETWINAKKAKQLGFVDGILFSKKGSEEDDDSDEPSKSEPDEKENSPKEPEEEKNPQKAQDSMLYSPSVTTASLMQKISATAPATGVPINQLEKRLALLKY